MKKSIFYLLSVNMTESYNEQLFKEKINLAVDWIQIMPNIFIIESTSDKSKWLTRLKLTLKENSFFITEMNIDNNTGFVSKWIWDWIDKKRKDA